MAQSFTLSSDGLFLIIGATSNVIERVTRYPPNLLPNTRAFEVSWVFCFDQLPSDNSANTISRSYSEKLV